MFKVAKVSKKKSRGGKKYTKSAQKTKAVKVPKLSIPTASYKKSELFRVLAEQTDLNKKVVKKVLEVLEQVMKLHLMKRGPGQFSIPGIIKMVTVQKPATPTRKGRDPFTGEEMMFKPKSARRVVKARILQKFKNARA